MAYVGLVAETEASPAVKQLYAQIEQGLGFLPDYYRALGRKPAVAEAHLAMNAAVMEAGAPQSGTLSAELKEKLLLVVSGVNSSSYCIAIHMEMLRRLGVPSEVGKVLATNYEGAAVEEKEKALYRLAEKLTRKPLEVRRADIEAVKQAGWEEAAVVEAVLVVAWANLINRVSFGLGLVVGQ